MGRAIVDPNGVRVTFSIGVQTIGILAIACVMLTIMIYRAKPAAAPEPTFPNGAVCSISIDEKIMLPASRPRKHHKPTIVTPPTDVLPENAPLVEDDLRQLKVVKHKVIIPDSLKQGFIAGLVVDHP